MVTPKSAPTVETPPAAPGIDQVMGLLQGMLAQLTTLNERVTAVESKAPQFRNLNAEAPPEADDDLPSHLTSKQGIKQRLESEGNHDTTHRQIPTMQGGWKADPLTLQRYPPRFSIDQWVRINPEALRHGSEDLTYDAILAKRRSRGIGRVRKVVELRRMDDGSFQWKYRVHVDHLTPRQGDGFLEYELLPYQPARRPA